VSLGPFIKMVKRLNQTPSWQDVCGSKNSNYHCAAIEPLWERFDRGWAAEFRDLLQGRDDLTEAVRSAYAVRNSIAHGGSANKGLVDVIRWFDAAQEVVEDMVLATT